MPLSTPLFEYGELQIKQVVKNVEFIFCSSDVRKYVDIWGFENVKTVLLLISMYFKDIDLTNIDKDYPSNNFPTDTDQWHKLMDLDEDMINSPFLDDTICTINSRDFSFSENIRTFSEVVELLI